MAKPLADSITSLLSHRPLNLLVRICALAAAALCGWLVYLKLTGSISSVVGCGGADGCAQVLGGRWSQWLGIPVSLLAFVFYTVVFLLTLDATQRRLGLNADRWLIAAAFLAIFCALWFVGILWFVEKAFCPYCAAAHTLGLIFAIPVLIAVWRRRLQSAPGFIVSAGMAAVPAMIILILGQAFGPAPQTYEIKETTLAPPTVVSVEPATNLQFFDGSLSYKTKELPMLGSPTAKYTLVEYFDYTCASCRDMHSDFDLVKTKRGQDIALIVLPCPLSRSCNPHLAPEIKDHPGACELAKFALAIWRRAPSQFPDYHHFLMRLPLPVNVELAKKQAQKLLGSESALQIALSDPWIEERLTTTFNEYRQLSAQDRKMPKLLLGGTKVMTGQAASPEAFLELINREFPAQ